MKLKEYDNRFPDRNIQGAILYHSILSNPMVLKMYSGGMAWFMPKDTYPNGSITFLTITPEELLELEVLGWIGKEPLMEGDTIVLMDNTEHVVEGVKSGNASPYPIITSHSQYKWKEVKMVKKKGGDEI